MNKPQWNSLYPAARAVYREKIKLKVLTHYGKGGKARCCWRGCNVVDPDMLSIDHVINNGAQDRERGTSGNLYQSLVRDNYPKGFQTLCHNHQWKKEIVRLRNKREKGGGPCRLHSKRR